MNAVNILILENPEELGVVVHTCSPRHNHGEFQASLGYTVK
jgi:hypothetical protein